MQDRSVLLLLLAAALLVAFLQSWRAGRARALARAYRGAADREVDRRTAARARSDRAIGGESGAAALLERAGYSVLARQVPGSWTVYADGEPVTFGLRADYLAARRGRRYIAEVKTGRLAPQLSHGPTRRQLLEYRAAFDVDGVLLVDADAPSITLVEVDLFGGRLRARGATARLAASALAAAIVFALGLLAGASWPR